MKNTHPWSIIRYSNIICEHDFWTIQLQWQYVFRLSIDVLQINNKLANLQNDPLTIFYDKFS